jgi:hypothetical protein
MERSALVNSLFVVEFEMRRAGASSLADTAQDMREFLVREFNFQLRLVEKRSDLHEIYRYASSAQRTISGTMEMNDNQRQRYQQLTTLAPQVRLLADAMSTQKFREWRQRNPFRVTYQPAYRLEIFDRFILNAAEVLAPVLRTAQRITDVRTDMWGDLDAIRSIMSGNYNVRLGPTELNYGLWATIGDGLLTAGTVLPIGGVGRHVVMFTAGGVSAAMAMAAVEVAPIREEWRGPLRFAAGLAAGVGGAALGNAALNLTTRTWLIVSRSRALAGAQTQLDEVEAQILRQGGANAPAELIRRRAELSIQVHKLEVQVAQLRGLNPQAIEAADAALAVRTRELAALEAQAVAPGQSQVQKAAKLNSAAMQQARQNYRAAQQAVDDVYRAVDAAAPASLRFPNNPIWGEVPEHVVRQAEEVTQRLGLPRLGASPGARRVLHVAVDELAPIDVSDIMALAEWHGREVSMNVVRLRSGAQRIVVIFGEEGAVDALSQALVTQQTHLFGEGALLLRVVHTQPGGILRPSNEDLWVALREVIGTEILARNPRTGEVIHQQITQHRAARLILNRVRASAEGPEGGLFRIDPSTITLEQRQMVERVLGYLPPELGGI